MPIVINNTNTTQAPKYLPKFFSDVLTGNGQGMGLLNVSLDFKNNRYKAGIDANKQNVSEIRCKAEHSSNNSAEYYHIPFTNIFTSTDKEIYFFAKSILAYQSAKDTFSVYDDGNGTIYYSIPVYAQFIKPFSKHSEKSLKIVYIHVKEITSTLSTEIVSSDSPFYILGVCGVTDPAEQKNYSVFKAISKMSELMQVHFNDITATYIGMLLADGTYPYPFTSIVKLTDFDLTFEHYSELFESIQKWLKLDIPEEQKNQLQALVLSNTSLLMLDSVHNLIEDKNKHSHTVAPQVMPQLADFLSPAQMEAAITNEPFVLVQAGAGTGKSTTIIERIKYMEASGVDPKDIRVLSLTNAAANNILQKNDKIQSMTIAKYISEIYKINYPKQEIVDYQTLKNTIMIYAYHKPNARAFRDLITDKDSMDLLIFIRDNFDEVVEILDLTGQTTLQIQSYISYLKAETFNYGKDTAHHFIVDETQDNNIFEFIYLMKIAALRKASLYIVGDASQTLYEFRGASSQALNAIETSGVFECIKLDINYRSNQYILDFANITLADIDVNRFAQIQLQSDQFETMTKDEFKDTVEVKPIAVDKLKDFEDSFNGILTINAESYIREKLANKEKVTLLARKGSDVHKLQTWAEKVFDTYIVTNLVPKRSYSSTLFSSYVQRFWNDLVMTPKSDIIKVVATDIDDKLVAIYRGRADSMRKASRFQINNWVQEQGSNIKFLQNEFRAGRMTHKEMMDKVRDDLINYEIRKNVIRQSLLKQEQNQQDKEELIEKSDILVSTVHSVKGLEFDNVVYLHRNSDTNNEEEKRIDYVALTRGKKSELILDLHTNRSYSKLAQNHQNLLENYQ